ncbi:MAG: hypothetical protein CVU39_18780 [Chloroflexi bacterium HGW-Chloroflexi-10]|nr:MAG: hypothetical protein CVU39_18780 [Chloroflexi bacterium HGW-Chloroflexi-10]
MPDVAAALGVPRLAAIEYPLGRTLGQPGDSEGQMAVLRAVLQALQDIQVPGGQVHLPFEWPRDARDLPGDVPPPPIVGYIMKHPLKIKNLLERNVP